jgi:outer membrane receptor protein involved in Fe transport
MKIFGHARPAQFRLNAVAQLFGTASLLGLGIASAAHAQETTPSDPEPIQQVTVSASRVAGFTAPTPTTVVGVADLERRGVSNIADILNDIPAFRASNTPTGGGGGTFSTSGQVGQNLLDLRGLGATRTLVLVNGRRHVAANLTGSVDLNMIPSVLVDRVETVTGGASAAWGSDAVAGVVNVILKKRLNGTKLDVAYGQSQEGDAKEKKVGLGHGMSFADDRGAFVIGAELVDSGAVGDYLSRDWGRQEVGLLSNPLNATNGQPRNIIGPAMHFATQNADGLINAGPLKGTTFAAGANGSSARPFQYGQVFGAGAYMFGGEGYGVANNSNQLLKAPVNRHSVFARTEYELSSGTRVWLELSTAGSRTDSQNGSARGNYTLKKDYAYLPSAIAAQMNASGLNTLTLGRYDLDFGYLTTHADMTTNRAAFGLAGDLGADWTWDAYFQAGQSTMEVTQYNNLNLANFNAALDAVHVGGNIVCRNPNLVTTTSTGTPLTAEAGCTPLNLLGNGAPSAAALNYIMGDSRFRLQTRQQVAALTVRGQPFSTWAGAASLATGLEYRVERGHQTSDAISQVNGWNGGNNKAFDGRYTVREAFAELAVPLAKNLPWAKSLDLNGAVRRTDYSTSGAVTTNKFGVVYEPNRSWLFRATRSLDIRAPNLNELFSSPSFGNLPIIGKDGVSRFTPVFTTGNRDLQPEVSRTSTFGLTVQPDWLPGLRASVDKYRIAVSGVITSLGGQQLVNRCLGGASELCSYVDFGPGGIAGGVPVQVTNPQVNLLGFLASGVDVEAGYQLKLAKLVSGAAGDISLRVLGTHVDHFATIDTVGTVDRVGQTGVGNGVTAGVPRWLWNTVFTYRRDRLSMSAQLRYIPKSIYDVTLIGPDNPSYSPTLANSINNNTVASRTYLNLSAQYTLANDKHPVQLYSAIDNALNKAPPLAPTASVMTNATFYDTVGRIFKLGARMQF